MNMIIFVVLVVWLIYQKKIGGMVSLYEAMVTGHNSDSYHAKQYAPPLDNSISYRLFFVLLLYW